MVVWRIAKKAYALDRVGIGAMLEGGRWNPINVPVIYAGMTIEIASFEKLVHITSVLPNDLVLVKITIPDEEDLYYKVEMGELPKDWNALPSSTSALDFGNKFIQENKFLGMIVPSVVIPEGRNIVINPNHPQWANCTMSIERDFEYDARLKKAAT